MRTPIHPSPAPGSVDRQPFGTLPDGRPVDAVTLVGRGPGALRMRCITYGGAIVSLHAPDRDGRMADVTLGYDRLEDYQHDPHFFGTLIGRYANRIASGRFTLGGRVYQLGINDPPNHLHGGPNGFHRVVWECEPYTAGTDVGVVFTHTAQPDDDGYPGTLHVRATYTITADDALVVDYHATATEPTPACFTQHSYFNLAGHEVADVLEHELTVNASRYTPVDEARIPTGEPRDVAGTPFDFREPREIGARIDDDDEQLRIGRGYDHNFVIDRAGDDGVPVFAARLHEPGSGRVLEIRTAEPGIQLYTANGLDRVVGKQWHVYGRRCAVALETQHFPDSPNHPEFPSAIVAPERELRSRTIYTFSTRPRDRHA